MVEISEQLAEVLNELRQSGEIEGSIIMRRDGVVIASDLQNVTSKNLAVISSLTSAAETTSIELKRGIFHQMVIESENGTIVGVNAGKVAILITLVKKGGNLGFVLISLESAANKIKKILS